MALFDAAKTSTEWGAQLSGMFGLDLKGSQPIVHAYYCNNSEAVVVQDAISARKQS